MSETSLQARLGLGADASPNRPKKAWKKYNGDHPSAAPWPPPESSSSPYQTEQGYNHGTPSLFERIGPKVARPIQPRSLLERMELQENESTDTAHPSSETDFIPLDSAYSPNVSCGGDGEIAVDRSPSFSEGRVLTGIRPAKLATQTTASGNGFPPANDRPDAYGARAADSGRADVPVDISLAYNKTTAQKAPGTIVIDRAAPVPTSVADSGPSTHASRSRPPLPLKARLGLALRSAVLENAKLRGPIDADKVERKVATMVTENVCEAFGAQIRKVKKEMDALHAEEAMARAKDQLLNGYGNKGAVGDESRNTWLNRRDSHSLLASTSILPTPPPSEPLPAENGDKEKAPPTAPRAMFNAYHRSASLKGKEKAVEPIEESDSAARTRRDSYTRPPRPSLRASPMQNVPSGEGPLSGRSPPRTVSASPTQSSFASHKRRFTGDELPRYRSPPLPQPPDRRGSFRSPSRSPARTSYSDRSSHRRSPSRRPRSRSRPRREYSLARSFNSRRPSGSRSPPPLSASYSNGFGPRSRRSSSRSTASRGTFSNGRPPPEHEFNSRHAHEKRPFVRSPASSRGRSIPRRGSRSPVPQRRKLTHPSPPRSRSPLSHRRAPSYDPDPRLGHAPRYHANGNDASYSTPRGRSPGRGYKEPLSQSMFDPPPPSSYPHRSSSPPPPPNPCNNVPGLWFVKVGAGSPTVLEGRIVVEPEFAATWGLLPTRSASTPPPNLSVVLLCLPTEAVSALYNSLAPTNPTPETLANAVAALETAWPQDGTLFLDMNDGAGGKTWLPHELDPASPLDVTNHIQPGPNVIRFIQLGSLVERTFILYASRREPPPDKPPDTDIVMVSQLFENAAVPTVHIDDPLFKFGPATTTVAASESFLVA